MPHVRSNDANPYESPKHAGEKSPTIQPFRLGPTGVVAFFIVAAINSGPLFCLYDWPSGPIRTVLNAILWSQNLVVDAAGREDSWWGWIMFAIIVTEAMVLTVLIGLFVRLGLRRPVTM